MIKGIFIDFDALVTMDNKVWIVNKKEANLPILKISQPDFNLIKNGVYKSQGNKVDFNGRSYWLPTELWNQIKIKCKNLKMDLSDVAISMQEFLNSELLEKSEFELNFELLDLLMNETSDIYVICSKQVKERYSSIIEKIKEKLFQKGLKIKTFYFISDNFLNQNSDEVRFKKIRLLLQHLVGYKTENDHFVDEEISKFDHLHFYDINSNTLKLTDEINQTLEYLLGKTDKGLREVIREDIEDFRPTFWCHKINSNEMKKIENKKVILNVSKIIKTFENFNPYL